MYGKANAVTNCAARSTIKVMRLAFFSSIRAQSASVNVTRWRIGIDLPTSLSRALSQISSKDDEARLDLRRCGRVELREIASESLHPIHERIRLSHFGLEGFEEAEPLDAPLQGGQVRHKSV